MSLSTQPSTASAAADAPAEEIPSRTEVFGLIGVVSATRSTQDAIGWSIFALFSASVSVIAGLLADRKIAPGAATAIGVTFCFVWWCAQLRVLAHQERQEQVLADLERIAKLPTHLRLARGRVKSSAPPVRNLMRVLPLAAMLAWIVFFTWWKQREAKTAPAPQSPSVISPRGSG